MAEDDGEEEKEALQKEVRQLGDKVKELEAALVRATRPIGDLMEQLEGMRSLAGNYYRLLEIYRQKGAISPEAVLPEVKDPISVEIVHVLFDRSGLNVSELTDRLRERRGSASRTVVRERLQSMVEDGIVVRDTGPGGVAVYSISEDVTDRWYRMLGLRR